MNNIFHKDEILEATPCIFGHSIIKYMDAKKLEKVSIFDIATVFKKHEWFSAKNLYFAMLFLFTLGIIDFQQSYIIKTKKNDTK